MRLGPHEKETKVKYDCPKTGSMPNIILVPPQL